MGLAATQARFLELTARKTNVEFQGQQINQQRTTLANQTSAYNTQLLSLKVPTPPSSANYTTTSYNWADSGKTTYTINPASIVPVADDDTGTKYNITYSYSESVNSAYQSDSDATDKVKRVANGTVPETYTYSINGTSLQMLDEDDDEDALATLRAATPNASASEKFYSYTTKNADNTTTTSYYSAADLEDADTNWNDSSKATINKYLIGEHTETKQDSGVATLQMNEDGRMTNISINGGTYAVNTSTSTDNDKYEDAMNQYQYDEAQYEKEMNDINAKLNIIQQQDKSLELQLKAVDTEQEAISTEMDAVKKVADKNIESSFKTFG